MNFLSELVQFIISLSTIILVFYLLYRISKKLYKSRLFKITIVGIILGLFIGFNTKPAPETVRTPILQDRLEGDHCEKQVIMRLNYPLYYERKRMRSLPKKDMNNPDDKDLTYVEFTSVNGFGVRQKKTGICSYWLNKKKEIEFSVNIYDF